LGGTGVDYSFAENHAVENFFLRGFYVVMAHALLTRIRHVQFLNAENRRVETVIYHFVHTVGSLAVKNERSQVVHGVDEHY
jgi:hypothetical protein